MLGSLYLCEKLDLNCIAISTNMIKQFGFLISFLLAFSVQAQLTADLRVDFIQPEDEQNLEAAEVYVAMLEVSNHGPDTIKSCDTLVLRVTFSGVPTPDPIYITGQTIPPGESIPLSQQIAFDQTWIGSSCTVCMRVDPVNAATSLYDPDTTNNEDCVEVHIVTDVTTVSEQQLSEIECFPNPAKDTFQIAANETILSLYAVDADGAYCALKANNGLVDCSGLKNGIYLLQIETSNGLFLSRLIIAH